MKKITIDGAIFVLMANFPMAKQTIIFGVEKMYLQKDILVMQ
jgi:hypothetical protein